MKNVELRQMDLASLEAKLLAQKSELAKLKSLRASGTKSEKPSQIRVARRLVARILTIVNEKKRAGQFSATDITAAEAAAVSKTDGPVPEKSESKAAAPNPKSNSKNSKKITKKEKPKPVKAKAGGAQKKKS